MMERLSQPPAELSYANMHVRESSVSSGGERESDGLNVHPDSNLRSMKVFSFIQIVSFIADCVNYFRNYFPIKSTEDLLKLA